MTRKGDICAVMERRDPLFVGGRSFAVFAWSVARVARASRDGSLIRDAVVTRQCGAGSYERLFHERDGGWQSYTISPEWHPAAATLIGREYPDADTLRQAIRDARATAE